MNYLCWLWLLRYFIIQVYTDCVRHFSIVFCVWGMYIVSDSTLG